ncbi:MAG: hypothetical protein J0L62_15805 [Bacteroidetes bacterium]|nr:hypothetical protein [Bacteroidota bacterium]
MHIIQNNPYRIVGLLVGATAKEHERQVKRLKQFIDAEQDPQDDFSFPTLGHLQRTLESVIDAASKLNLDSDKMNAAMFWFYKGNPITDEPAFDAIKEADLDQVINIWTKLTSSGEVSQRNASAYNNLGTLYLSGILVGTNSKEVLLEQGISLKLKFLESGFIKDFKALATDETFKTTKKELQLLFLNQVQSEIEKSGGITSNKLLDILTKQEFSAKEDFLKIFVKKAIEQIEKIIEEVKTQRKANKANALNIGKGLFEQTTGDLNQIKLLLGKTSQKYCSIADKLADEILQCSIDYFNFWQKNESNINYFDFTWKLAKLAEGIAVGKLTKDRVADSLKTLQDVKDKEITQALELLQSIQNAYEANKSRINSEVRSMRLGPDQTINWTKVDEMIENSLDWNKVVSLIQEVIPPENVDKIKNINNQNKINEYIDLVIFLMEKLSYLQKNKIKYICYWEASGPSMPTASDFAKIPVGLKWVGAIVLLLIVLKACE